MIKLSGGMIRQGVRKEIQTKGVIGGTFKKRRPEECYDLIENMTAHHNDWETSAQRSESSSSITSFSDPEIVALKAEMAEINKNFPATVGQTPNVYAMGAYQG
nr:reverse transcriptase domain-containing protein [Tanacetum cinerariifolium]